MSISRRHKRKAYQLKTPAIATQYQNGISKYHKSTVPSNGYNGQYTRKRFIFPKTPSPDAEFSKSTSMHTKSRHSQRKEGRVSQEAIDRRIRGVICLVITVGIVAVAIIQAVRTGNSPILTEGTIAVLLVRLFDSVFQLPSLKRK